MDTNQVADRVPALAGVFRVTLPVSDVAASTAWYRSRLGFQPVLELVEDGRLTGVRLRHPGGGLEFALRLDRALSAMAAGFDSFAIGVADRATLDALARHLTALGEQHGGVHPTANGWVLPLLHDPDGRELRFCTVAAEAQPAPPPELVASAASAGA